MTFRRNVFPFVCDNLHTVFNGVRDDWFLSDRSSEFSIEELHNTRTLSFNGGVSQLILLEIIGIFYRLLLDECKSYNFAL